MITLSPGSIGGAGGIGCAGAAIVAIGTLASPAMAKVHEQTRELSVAHADGSAITVDTHNGSISIRAHDGAEILITAELKSKSESRLANAEIVAERDEHGRLEIECDWPGGKPKSKDACSFEVLVPSAFGVEADTNNGSITIAGLAGELSADTNNGSINIESHDGDVHTDTNNGSITVSDATGAVYADTNNGAIDVTLADASTGPVELDTNNGSVTLTVGPSFVGMVRAGVDLGRVNIGPFPEGVEARIVTNELMHARVVFNGEDSPISDVETNLGSVTIKARTSAPL